MEVHEPSPAYKRQFVSVKEYLEQEKLSFQKREFYKGEVFAIAGVGSRHNVIFKNVYLAVGNALKGKTCQPYGSDLRIHIPENTLFTYPDISIICGDIVSSPDDEDSAGETGIQGSRDAIRIAFERGIIKSGDKWMNMIQSRIRTAHTYDKETADEIATEIVSVYYDLFVKFQKTMEEF